MVRRARAGLTLRTRLLLAAIVVVGLLLRLASYRNALFGDELSTYFVVRGHGLQRMVWIIRSEQEQTPPLYFVTAWLAAKLGGGVETLRLPSLLAGLAAIPVVHALGVRTVGRRAGLVAAALVALSPFLIFYSTEARSYSLLMTLGLVSTYALVRALESGRVRWWGLYAAASSAVMYTHYTGAFLLAGQAVWALASHRRAWRPLMIANAAAALAFLPWLPGYREDAASPATKVIGIIHPFGLHNLIGDVSHVALGLPFVHLGLLPGPVGIALTVLGLVLAAAGILWARGRLRPPRPVVLLVTCALVVPIGAAIASIVGPSVYLSRNLITAAPYLALLAGTLVSAPRPPLRAPATALLIAGSAIAGALTLERANQRPDYNAVVDYVRATGRAGDPVAEIQYPFAAPAVLQSLEVALREHGLAAAHPVLRVGLPTVAADVRRREPPGPGQFAPLPVPSGAALARRAAVLARGGTLFVALAGGVTPAELRRLPQSEADAFMRTVSRGFRQVGAKHFPGIASGVELLIYRPR